MEALDSVLISIKKLLGLAEDYDCFDSDIIMDINAALVILWQIGIGDEPKSITGSSETWSDLFPNNLNLIGLIKSYVHKRVQLMFDSNTFTSSVIESINKQIQEDEWRLNVAISGIKME